MSEDGCFFALTSDIDWTSEPCIAALLDFARAEGIRPTLFATHRSAIIDEASAAGAVEVGVHPNFLPGSTHGSDIASVIDHVCALYPQAKCFRSHSFFDAYPICMDFKARGFEFDSNLLTYLDEGLRPLRHGSGLTRLPVFWEDDVHSGWPGATWEVDDYYDRFRSPGLKILNTHPLHFALNIPSPEFYQNIRALKKSLRDFTPADIEHLAHRGRGVRTFICELIHRLRQDGIAFHTLGEVYQAHKSALADPDAGRTERVSSAQYRAYRQGDDTAKQSALRDLYGGRNTTDRYATSRDYNLRELEISAIANELKQETPGRLIDFGCGNGYTLISLAHALKGWKFEGIDFTPSLIKGAHLLAAEATFANNAPQFFCADAIARIRDMGAASIDAALTERFIVNLPSRQAQHDFIRQIARVLRPGGLFLMCEGSREGHHALNRLRQTCGLNAIPENSEDNLSALRFDEVEIEHFLTLTGFDLLAKRGFSSYFAMSRALHPALVAPQQPRFKARINDLARSIQEGLPFTPGLGSNVLWALRKT